MNASCPRRFLPVILGCFALALALAGTWTWDLFCGSPVEELARMPMGHLLLSPISYLFILSVLLCLKRHPGSRQVIVYLTIAAALARPLFVFLADVPAQPVLSLFAVALAARITGSWLTICVARATIIRPAPCSALVVALSFAAAHELARFVLTLPPDDVPKSCALMPSLALAIVVCCFSGEAHTSPKLAFGRTGANEKGGCKPDGPRHLWPVPESLPLAGASPQTPISRHEERLLASLVLLFSITTSLARPIPANTTLPIELVNMVVPLLVNIVWIALAERLRSRRFVLASKRTSSGIVSTSIAACLIAAVPPVITLVMSLSANQAFLHQVAHNAFSLTTEYGAWLAASMLANRPYREISTIRLARVIALISIGHLAGALLPVGTGLPIMEQPHAGIVGFASDPLRWYAIPLAAMLTAVLYELAWSRRERYAVTFRRLAPHAERPAYVCAPQETGVSDSTHEAPLRKDAPPELPFHLTAREAQIFELMVRGLSAADIAKTLELSPSTIRVHMHNIRKKQLEIGAAITPAQPPGPGSSPSS